MFCVSYCGLTLLRFCFVKVFLAWTITINSMIPPYKRLNISKCRALFPKDCFWTGEGKIIIISKSYLFSAKHTLLLLMVFVACVGGMMLCFAWSRDVSHPAILYLIVVPTAVFGLGTMIAIGLDLGKFLEIPLTSPCFLVLQGVNPLLQMIFTFMQMYFIFMNARVSQFSFHFK